MSRYIDYDALDYKNWHMIGKSNDFFDGVVYMAERIEEAPSIDIVRCKECKFWIGHISDDDGFDEGLDECRWRDSEAPDADDFCSYGERREP